MYPLVPIFRLWEPNFSHCMHPLVPIFWLWEPGLKIQVFSPGFVVPDSRFQNRNKGRFETGTKGCFCTNVRPPPTGVEIACWRWIPAYVEVREDGERRELATIATLACDAPFHACGRRWENRERYECILCQERGEEWYNNWCTYVSLIH